MAKSYFPVAIAFAVGSSFLLWYSMEGYERAKYFALIVGIPVTVYAFLELFGVAKSSLTKQPTYVKTSG